MNSQQTAFDLYAVNMTEKDRIMAAAYLARSQYLAELLLKAAGALKKLAAAFMEGVASTKQWSVH